MTARRPDRKRRSRRFWSWKPRAGRARAAPPCCAMPRTRPFVSKIVNALAAQAGSLGGIASRRWPGDRRAGADVLRDHGLHLEDGVQSRLRKYSPGALLIDKITDDLFSIRESRRSIPVRPNEASWAQLWSGRRKMVDLLVDVGPGRSLAFSLEAIRQRGYDQLRRLRDRFGPADAGRTQKQESEFCRASLGPYAACWPRPWPRDRVDLAVTLYLTKTIYIYKYIE